jgi:hypothetical protein
MADDCENEVGYKKPPKRSQFEKGKSGNPSGRPRKDPSIAAVFQRVSRQVVHTTGKRGKQRMTKLEASVTQVVNRAATGDLKATKVLMEMASRFPDLTKNPESILIVTHLIEPPPPSDTKSGNEEIGIAVHTRG